jgi:hypothetical protein
MKLCWSGGLQVSVTRIIRASETRKITPEMLKKLRMEVAKIKEAHAFQAFMLRKNLDYSGGRLFKMQSDAIDIIERRLHLLEKYVLLSESSLKSKRITPEVLDKVRTELAELAQVQSYGISAAGPNDTKGIVQAETAKSIEMQMYALERYTEKKLDKIEWLLRFEKAKKRSDSQFSARD